MYVAERISSSGQAPLDAKLLAQIADHAMILNPSATVHILDSLGQARWPPPLAANSTRLDQDLLRALLKQTTTGRPLFGPVPGAAEQSRLISIASLKLANQESGYVYITFPSSTQDGIAAELSSSFAIRSSLGQLLAAILVTFAVALLATYRLTRPLRRLHREVVLSSRQLGVAEQGHGRVAGEEVATITCVFRTLTERVKEQLVQLRQVDASRRELLAHVSHDLRTPLTAMRGYLESLALLGESLSERERARFITTCVRHSDRLSKLVDRLFLLARLDTSSLSLNPELIALADLAQDIVGKWQVAAERRDVRLSLRLDNDPGLISADIALIEAVFENLLDNALRHSGAGHAVTVRIRIESPHVAIDFLDEGTGMAPALLSAAQSAYVVGPGGRSGLGLAIVRRVATLHGGRFDLSSQLGQGTRATFLLPMGIAPRAQTVMRDDPVTKSRATSMGTA
jgi:signal transduction histidine kinase